MKSVVISSGHGKYVSGARGLIDEITEARSVVKRVVEYLRKLDVTVYEYHDNTSKTQNDNLKALVKYHNSKTRELDVSVHFNSGTKEIGGVEVLYYDEKELATKMSSALAKAMGIRDRGAKQRIDLYFLKNTNKPAILIEVCFVDCKSDTDAYGKNFDAVCKTIAEILANKKITISNSSSEVKLYRLMTGTFNSKGDAEKAKQAIIKAKIANVVYVKEE